MIRIDCRDRSPGLAETVKVQYPLKITLEIDHSQSARKGDVLQRMNTSHMTRAGTNISLIKFVVGFDLRTFKFGNSTILTDALNTHEGVSKWLR